MILQDCVKCDLVVNEQLYHLLVSSAPTVFVCWEYKLLVSLLNAQTCFRHRDREVLSGL